MLRKYTLIASVLVAFGVPCEVRAQTTLDVTMKIQAILDHFSQIRSDLKQVKSSEEIQKMRENLGGTDSWKDKLKDKIKGKIFNRASKSGGASQSLFVVPNGLKDKVNVPAEAVKWLRENMTIPADATREEQEEIRRKRDEMRAVAQLSGYGQIIAIRKQLDKALENIDKLKQDAEETESETDLQNEINKLALLKLEQVNYQQMLDTIAFYMDGADSKLDAAALERQLDEELEKEMSKEE